MVPSKGSAERRGKEGSCFEEKGVHQKCRCFEKDELAEQRAAARGADSLRNIGASLDEKMPGRKRTVTFRVTCGKREKKLECTERQRKLHGGGRRGGYFTEEIPSRPWRDATTPLSV